MSLGVYPLDERDKDKYQDSVREARLKPHSAYGGLGLLLCEIHADHLDVFCPVLELVNMLQYINVHDKPLSEV